jgi:hypothetical protein
MLCEECPGSRAPTYLSVEESDFTENKPEETHEFRNNLTYFFPLPGSINL